MVERIPTGHRTRWALITCALAAALIAGVPWLRDLVETHSTEIPKSGPRRPRWDPAVLAKVEAILAPPASADEPRLEKLVERISRLGPDAVGPLIALVCGDVVLDDHVPGATNQLAHPRALQLRDQVLQQSLASFRDEDFVSRAIDYGTGDAALDVKLVVVRLLGRRGAAGALPGALAVLDGVDAMHFQRSFVQQSIEPAFAQMIERDPRRIFGVEQKCASTLLPSLVRAAGSVRSTATVEWLAGQLGKDPELDLELLVELGHAGTGGRLAIPDGVLRRLRDSLTQMDDRRKRVAAAMLGELRDSESFDDLVNILDEDNVLLVAAARGALSELVGKDLGPTVDAWYDWRVEQDTWNAQVAPAVYVQLFDPDPALASQAVGELISHPFFRHEAAAAIAERLFDAEGELYATCCLALTGLASSRGTPGLLEALQRDDDGQRELAAASLHTLTGLDLEPVHAIWSRALER
jgi:hypothetical protein